MIAHGNKIKLFAGNGSRKLAQAIADKLKMQLADAEVGTFSDGECSVHIGETVRGCDVFVIQSTSYPVNDNLMELLVMIDALRRASAGRITAVMPYFGYARQDRKARARDPITAKLVADLITTAGADRVLTMDLHAAQIQGFFSIPVDQGRFYLQFVLASQQGIPPFVTENIDESCHQSSPSSRDCSPLSVKSPTSFTGAPPSSVAPLPPEDDVEVWVELCSGLNRSISPSTSFSRKFMQSISL